VSSVTFGNLPLSLLRHLILMKFGLYILLLLSLVASSLLQVKGQSVGRSLQDEVAATDEASSDTVAESQQPEATTKTASTDTSTTETLGMHSIYIQSTFVLELPFIITLVRRKQCNVFPRF
jgi:hypothetical protein